MKHDRCIAHHDADSGEQEEVLGSDPWAYGLTPANRKNLETVLRYTHQHGLIRNMMRLEGLFADTDLGDAGRADEF